MRFLYYSLLGAMWLSATPAFGVNAVIMGDYAAATDGTFAPFCRVVEVSPGGFEVYFVESLDNFETPTLTLQGGANVSGDRVILSEDVPHVVQEFAEVKGTAEGLIATRGEDILMQVRLKDGSKHGFKRVPVEPQSLGKAPPQNALVLFDGSGMDAWRTKGNWRVRDGVMTIVPGEGSILSRETFGAATIHLEFRTPHIPELAGEEDIVSLAGVLIAGRYEIQIAESFGDESTEKTNGAILGQAAPQTNASLPPGDWQSLDIQYQPAYYELGRKVADAQVTVILNDETIHFRTSLEGPTPGDPSDDESKPGGLLIREKGYPVQFRNIWIQPEGF